MAILTAITEEEEDEETQEELRQELMEQIMSGLEEKKTLEGQKSVLEQEIAEYLAKKKVCDIHIIMCTSPQYSWHSLITSNTTIIMQADKDQLELPRPAPDIRNYSIILSEFNIAKYSSIVLIIFMALAWIINASNCR